MLYASKNKKNHDKNRDSNKIVHRTGLEPVRPQG